MEIQPTKKRGGGRPGAGRKSAQTLDYQAGMRAVVERVVTPEKWEAAVAGMLATIAAGNSKAFVALAPYVMGAVPKEISGQVDKDGRFVFVVE